MPNVWGSASPARQSTRHRLRSESDARHVQNVVIDFEGLPPGFVKLRVGQQPASLGSIPNFANNVVLEVAGIEITPEPTANSRGNSLGSQHGDKKHREVAADSDQTPLNRPSAEN